jgi:hypothetical protein
MNFFQMICCALLMKGSELSNQYLETGYGVAQGYVRRQLRPVVPATWRRKLAGSATVQTADQELRQFLTDGIKATEVTGYSLCKCASATPVPSMQDTDDTATPDSG